MECLFDQTLLKIFIELWFGGCPFRPSAGERGGCDNRSISAAEPALDRDTQRRDWEVKKSAGSFSLRPSLLETLSHEKSHMLVDLWGMISSPQPTVDVSCWHGSLLFWLISSSWYFIFVYICLPLDYKLHRGSSTLTLPFHVLLGPWGLGDPSCFDRGVKERVFGFGECVCERNNFKFAPKNMLPCECLGYFHVLVVMRLFGSRSC